MRNLVFHADIIIVGLCIVLLLLNNNFRRIFRYILPIAILYEVLRFISLSEYYQSSYPFHFVVIGSQWLLAVTFYSLNRRQLPAICVVTGSLCNAIVVFSNNFRMPASWLDTPDFVPAGYTVMSIHTNLNVLGDWIRLYSLPSIFSVGDIIIFTGFMVVFIYYAWLKFYRKTV